MSDSRIITCFGEFPNCEIFNKIPPLSCKGLNSSSFFIFISSPVPIVRTIKSNYLSGLLQTISKCRKKGGEMSDIHRQREKEPILFFSRTGSLIQAYISALARAQKHLFNPVLSFKVKVHLCYSTSPSPWWHFLRRIKTDPVRQPHPLESRANTWA